VATGPWRVAVIAAVLVVLTAVNIVGIQRAAVVNNILTAAKLIPLALFVLVGLFFVDTSLLTAADTPAPGALATAVLLGIYAFSGFEVLGVPGGEVREPERTIPFALLAGLGIVALVYVGVQAVAVGTLPALGDSTRPLADAAEGMFGPAGALLMVVGALLSTFGVAHAILLAAGRMPFAMAERNQLPKGIAAVHPRYRTPHVALIVSAVGMLAFTYVTTFASAVTITVGLRLVIYIVTCAALPVLRRRARGPVGGFRAPGGTALAVGSVLVGIGLLASQRMAGIIPLLAVMAMGLVLWLVAARPYRR
jgi:amino acid transporter